MGFNAIVVVTGTGLLVLHYIFKEEYGYIRPFVVIGTFTVSDLNWPHCKPKMSSEGSSSCRVRSCFDRRWGDGHHFLL